MSSIIFFSFLFKSLPLFSSILVAPTLMVVAAATATVTATTVTMTAEAAMARAAAAAAAAVCDGGNSNNAH